MSDYRDPLAASHARIAELEAELEEARSAGSDEVEKRIARLERELADLRAKPAPIERLRGGRRDRDERSSSGASRLENQLLRLDVEWQAQRQALGVRTTDEQWSRGVAFSYVAAAVMSLGGLMMTVIGAGGSPAFGVMMMLGGPIAWLVVRMRASRYRAARDAYQRRRLEIEDDMRRHHRDHLKRADRQDSKAPRER